jgi:hypothetical protein
MTWPAVVVWISFFAGMVQRSPLFLLYLFFGLGAFGSLNLLGEGGSVNVLPQAGCAIFLVCKILLSKGQLSRAVDMAIDPSKLGLFSAFTCYGLFTAYVMPRFFAHMVQVNDLNSVIPWPILLAPSTSNLSQSVYLASSLGIALVFSLSGQNASFRRHYLQASLVGGLLLIATGLADMTLAAAGLEELLKPFRTANYSLLTDQVIMGSKRVVGLMPEPSSYGPPCLLAAASLTFLRPCFENKVLRDYLVPLTVAGLLAMAWLSASSTAYLGLAAFAAVFGVNWLRRTLSTDTPAQDGLKWEAIIVLAAALACLGAASLVPHAMDYIYDKLDVIIFKKSESSSYAERTEWTRVAMQAFFATDGLGVGLGSARTSNWFVAVLSNTGIFGTALLVCFILRLLFQRCRSADPRLIEFTTALKYSLLPWFVVSAASWPTADFGVGVASTLGLIASLTGTSRISSVRSGVTVAQQIRARSRPRSTHDLHEKRSC